MFQSKEEFIAALIEGRKFIDHYGAEYWYDEEWNHPFRESDPSLGKTVPFYNFSIFDQVEEVSDKWYHNIPLDGVLCWVGYMESGNDQVDIITRKTGDNEYESATHNYWDWAEPMTEEEVKKFIYKQKSTDTKHQGDRTFRQGDKVRILPTDRVGVVEVVKTTPYYYVIARIGNELWEYFPEDLELVRTEQEMRESTS